MNLGRKTKIIGGIVGGVVILGIIIGVATAGGDSDRPTETVVPGTGQGEATQPVQRSQPTPTPRRSQQTQPRSSSGSSGTVRVEGILFYCSDLLLEYNAMLVTGQDAAVMHLSNVMNIDALGQGKHISIGEASRALEACR